MPLTFFSRCEGTTLDGTHDYSAGDTTWTLVSGAEFSTSGVKVGTNGLYTPSGDDYAQLDAASIVDRTVGTVAFWLRINTIAAFTWIFNLQGTAAADRITIEDGGGGDLTLRHRVNGGNNIAVSTSSAGLTTAAWYFVQAHWSAAQDDLRLEVYNSSGTLIQAAENLSANLGGSPADIISIQAGTQQASGRFSIDNIFIGNSYADDFLASRDITSYTSYGFVGPPKSLGLLLRGCG